MKILAEIVHKETIFSSEAKLADIISTKPSLFEHFKNNEIASMLNMTPETLSRILTRLKKANIIEITNHVINILDKKALEKIIDTNKLPIL
jgi:CRP/FNR family transcriptional regulator